MTPAMLNDVHTLAPRVAAWLKKIGAIKLVGLPVKSAAIFANSGR
jgi:hypothetical protein